MLVFLFGAMFLGLAWLDGYAQRTKGERPFQVGQQLWSHEDSGLFVIMERPKREMVWVSRDGENQRALFTPPADSKLVSYMGYPETLVFQSESGIRLFQSDGNEVELPEAFSQERFLTVAEGDIYFWRLQENEAWEAVEVDRPEVEGEPQATPTPSKKALVRRSIEVLSWRPEQEQPVSHLKIPFQNEEELELLAALPSPDKRFLALAMRFSKNLPWSVWIYDHQSEDLSWTTIEVEGEEVRFAWSPDSVSLLAVGADMVYLLPSALETNHSKFSTHPLRFTPRWCDNGRLFLLDGLRLFQLDIKDFKAEEVIKPLAMDGQVTSIALSENGDQVAVVSQVGPREYITSVGIKSGKHKQLLRDRSREAARQTLLFRLGRAIHTSRLYWSGN